MSEHIVADVSEIADGERILVELKGREVGIFYLDGEYYAFANWCAHQGGPWCEGTLTGTFEGEFNRDTLEYRLNWVKEGRILNCPWHGWEYDVKSGICLSRRSVKLPSYPVKTENGKIVVSL